MPSSYHRFAGSSLDRLAALSDGVFAVAMTLLVLDLHAPSVPKRTQHPVWSVGGVGAVLFIGLEYADQAGLMSDDTTEDMRTAMKRRIAAYQCLYALAAWTCLINTYLAIGLLIALQLNSVIAPRIGILDRA